MKIYTKTGDAGDTGLFGGQRVLKSDARVDAYGLLDETNSALGVARSHDLGRVIDALLQTIQGQLFTIGAELATPESHRDRLRVALIGDVEVRALEALIDRFEAELEPLETFVLPAGTLGASGLHHARTVCRRAERAIVAIAQTAAVRREVLEYLNRLSDALFVLARVANRNAGVPDVAWAPRSK